MGIQVESNKPGEFLKSEGNGDISRENITVVSGQVLLAGAVIGKITSSGKYKEFDPAAVDGSENAAAVLIFDADASGGDTEKAVVERLSEINQSLLVWKSGITDNEKAAALIQLAAKLIIAR